jgi:hypothetical protein
MKKVENIEFITAWHELRKKVAEEPVADSLGLDLQRGDRLNPYNVLEHQHLQIFGKNVFLRNMIQRALIRDLDQFAPVFFIAPADETGLLEEITKVMTETNSRSNITFYYSRQRPKLSIQPAHILKIFKKEFFEGLDQYHLYVELDGKCFSEEKTLLSKLDLEIKCNFPIVEEPWCFKPRKPFVYLIYPEKLDKKFSLRDYVESLMDHVSFRVCAENYQLFNREKASLVYGPDLYPVETYEKMRSHCYAHFPANDRPYYLSESEYGNALKMAKEMAKCIPVDQTAFARFKSWLRPGYKYAWFYPVQQSLGRMPYEQPAVIASWVQQAKKLSLTADDNNPSVSKILEDLRPKNRDSARVVC